MHVEIRRERKSERAHLEDEVMVEGYEMDVVWTGRGDVDWIVPAQYRAQ
jgi:hypothetical protein